MKKYILGAVFSLGLLVSPIFVSPVEAAGLTSTQISAILDTLQAFGADQSVINNVSISLGGGVTATGDSSSALKSSVSDVSSNQVQSLTTEPVFVFAGQSNMAGSASVSELTATENQTQTNVDYFYPVTNTWAPYRPLYQTSLEGVSGQWLGPEVSAGKTLATSLNKKIGMVKYAVPGKDLANDWNPNKVDGIYAHMLNRVNTALNSKGKNAKVGAFFWMQGETDASNQVSAQAYQTNLTAFIAKVRSDFNDPNLPFIIGKIAPSTYAVYGAVVRAAQEYVAANIPNVEIFSTDDLPKYSDGLHYTTRGIINLGTRFANTNVVVGPTAQTSNNRPTGHVDSASSGAVGTCGMVAGWAFDADKASATTEINVYVDGPAGSGTGHYAGVTNALRQDVNSGHSISGKHGYIYQIPDLTAGTHTAYVYSQGVDTAGNKITTEPVLLTNSPMTFTCSTATQAPAITVISPNGGSVLTKNSKVVSSLSSVDSQGQIFEIKWTGAPDSFADVYGDNVGNPSRIAAYLEQNVNGQFSTVGRIIPSAYGSIMWIVGQISDTNCLNNNNNSYPLPTNQCQNSVRLVSPGNYYVKIVDTTTGAIGRSNAFTIVSANTTPVAPTVTSSFSPSTISSTGSTVYSYSSTNSTHCVATHPDGTLTWDNVTPNASFSMTYNASQFPNGLTTTITCYNAAGQSAVSTQTLTVQAASTPAPTPTVTSSFSPSTITSTGSTVYSYSSTNSTHCVATHPDWTDTWDNVTPNASFSGTYSASQFPNGLTTTITCYNAAGQWATSTKTLTVTQPDYTPFLTTTYQTELGRAPDTAGLAYWIDRMNGGTSQATVTEAFHNSAEGVNYRFLKSLYQTELGRTPDAAGLAYWIDRMNGGTSQATVTEAFHNSAEAVTWRANHPTSYLSSSNQTASALDAFNSTRTSEVPEGDANTFSYTWNKNLQIGSSYTEDVKALQTALVHEGLYTGEISGGFYNQTFSGVKAFQEKYGIDTGITGAGFVGAKTRAKLNTLY